MKNPVHVGSNIYALRPAGPRPAHEEQDGRVYEYACLDGRIHGVLRISSATHRPLAELQVEHGVIHGPATVFAWHHTSDRTVHFHRGLLHGRFDHRAPSGAVRALGGFTAGVPTGHWLLNDDDGATVFEDRFDAAADLGRALEHQDLLTQVALPEEILNAMRRFDLFAVDHAPDQLLAA